jgi:hypothetical protein
LDRIQGEYRNARESLLKDEQELVDKVKSVAEDAAFDLRQRAGRTFPLRHKISGPNSWKKNI